MFVPAFRARGRPLRLVCRSGVPHRPGGGKDGGELLQAVKSIRELADDFDKRSGALMSDGRRTLGDISRAVNNLDKNPTRLLFGAGSGSAPAEPPKPAPERPPAGQKRQ
jgi:phospholipid/cholesterol/gamma-HCH transport system substrate-binding protein